MKMDLLINQGLVQSVMGKLPEPMECVLVVWARSKPKPVFKAYIELAKILSPYPLQVFIDDVCSQTIMRISDKQQRELDEAYNEFFSPFNCSVTFSSNLYKQIYGNDILLPLLEFGRSITMNEFQRCLPGKKREKYQTLNLDEILHALLQLFLFKHVQNKSRVLLIGRFSQAIVTLHRNISAMPLDAIVLPKLRGDVEIVKYLSKVKEVRNDLIAEEND